METKFVTIENRGANRYRGRKIPEKTTARHAGFYRIQTMAVRSTNRLIPKPCGYGCLEGIVLPDGGGMY